MRLLIPELPCIFAVKHVKGLTRCSNLQNIECYLLKVYSSELTVFFMAILKYFLLKRKCQDFTLGVQQHQSYRTAAYSDMQK